MSARRDRGSISAVVVVMTVALVLCAGLVIDGGRSVGTYVEAADHAENAARAGAQELTGLRAGEIKIDAERARSAAAAYLAEAGVDGRISITGTQVSVTVTMRRPAALLQLVGVSTLHASATRTADPVTR